MKNVYMALKNTKTGARRFKQNVTHMNMQARDGAQETLRNMASMYEVVVVYDDYDFMNNRATLEENQDLADSSITMMKESVESLKLLIDSSFDINKTTLVNKAISHKLLCYIMLGTVITNGITFALGGNLLSAFLCVVFYIAALSTAYSYKQIRADLASLEDAKVSYDSVRGDLDHVRT